MRFLRWLLWSRTNGILFVTAFLTAFVLLTVGLAFVSSPDPDRQAARAPAVARTKTATATPTPLEPAHADSDAAHASDSASGDVHGTADDETRTRVLNRARGFVRVYLNPRAPKKWERKLAVQADPSLAAAIAETVPPESIPDGEPGEPEIIAADDFNATVRADLPGDEDMLLSLSWGGDKWRVVVIEPITEPIG